MKPVATPDDGSRQMPGILVFVLADIASFLLFLVAFMVERSGSPIVFDQSAALLDRRYGIANTLVLVTSGFCVAAAERLHAEGDAGARRWLFAGITVGGLFALIKGLEYHAKIAAGIWPTTNAFFGYYFVLTGLHFLHYAAGMVLLTVLALGRFRARADYSAWLRGGAIYWHMVDVIWFFLFPLLYLQVRS